MRVCDDHWQVMKDAIDQRGLTPLVSKDGKEACDNLKDEIEGNESRFDPLMSMFWHWVNNSVAQGGLYLMGLDESGNQYCPICEYTKHCQGFDAEREIGITADQMRDYAVQEHLIPGV